MDITGRKQAELALRESEEKYRTLIDQAAEMLFFHDLDGNLVDVNRRRSRRRGIRATNCCG
jgi:PAS domain S-box-containing protein